MTCSLIMGRKHLSSPVFSSRWSVQRGPTGHKLFTSCSSLADSWEESRRKLLSWSFRALIPPSSGVASTITRPGQPACYDGKKNIGTIWKPYNCIVVSIVYLWETFADICYGRQHESAVLRQIADAPVCPTSLQTYVPIRTQKSLSSHVSYSLDICRQTEYQCWWMAGNNVLTCLSRRE